jgi:hypothetical protein
VEPRAPARTRQEEERFDFRETRSLFRETRCERFDVVEPRAPLHNAFRETRCERFDVVEPRAPGCVAVEETRSIFGATRSVGGEARELNPSRTMRWR